jgi:transcription-repair coupling factor (superfamily II helicase)
LGVRGLPFKETLTKLDQLRAETGIFLVARSAGQVERLIALLHDHGFPANTWQQPFPHQPVEGRPPFYCLKGELSAGFISHDGQLAFVTEEELFGKGIRHRPQTKSPTAKFFSTLDDLKEGDLVVHLQHGIGRYLGLRRLEVQEFTSDYLLLQFGGTDTLYVPLDRLNQIHRYRGAEQRSPRLDRLGGTSWGKTKAKVRKGIEDMTEELVELYANREVARRAAYEEDTLLVHEFEAGFEYEETPDQQRTIEEIGRDMESPKPMDRLVCGDVGYGKTEVAMRAAFKAIQANRQVAVLVPTTLLAQQHYENFSLRFAPFPVKIAVLSRFQTAAEIKATLKDLAAGLVDIVVGTHRVVQKDVVFKQLGLVIIDEEQWIGVRHKERLKQLRTQVDVLTLSATPIPRTLQMAFSGVRDLSVIETAPPGRLAVETQVLRFDATVVREAIRREIARGGQVFYVHNRVETMEQNGAWLQDLLPEARVLMAHGQMNEKLLERVMLQFFHHEADVLLSSAIIQSGLDIPNAIGHHSIGVGYSQCQHDISRPSRFIWLVTTLSIAGTGRARRAAGLCLSLYPQRRDPQCRRAKAHDRYSGICRTRVGLPHCGRRPGNSRSWEFTRQATIRQYCGGWFRSVFTNGGAGCPATQGEGSPGRMGTHPATRCLRLHPG